jgi:hypothetical protein
MSIQVNPQSDQFSNQPVRAHSEVTDPSSGTDAGTGFRQVLGGAVSVAGQLATGVASAYGMGPLVGGLNNSLNGAAGIGGAGGDINFTDLLQQQNQIQRESLVFNSETNISKTDHESRMSAVRNFKS